MTPAPTTPASVAEVLDRAADLIEQPGKWTQGAYARGKFGEDLLDGNDRFDVPPDAECFCLYGAVAYVEGTSVAESEAGQFLEDRGVSACDWNDAPERTQAEVVAALRSAAEAARTQEVG